ncbi:MAG TPA: cupin domain-containing protein [Phenylobacterium sp.]|nr:cupin domain-containing protein [Phenylobacterium sp.]
MVAASLPLAIGSVAAAAAQAAPDPKAGEPLIITPGSVPRYTGQQGREADITELLARAEQTGGSLGVFRQTIAPGSGPPAHIHRHEGEFAYVLSGDFKFRLGDSVVSVPVGSFIFIPRGATHAFKNVGAEPGVLLFGVTPGGLETMFAQRQGVDAETNKKLMQEHQMEVVGPPIN